MNRWKLPPKIFWEDQELHATMQKKGHSLKNLCPWIILGEKFQGWAQKKQL